MKKTALWVYVSVIVPSISFLLLTLLAPKTDVIQFGLSSEQLLFARVAAGIVFAATAVGLVAIGGVVFMIGEERQLFKKKVQYETAFHDVAGLGAGSTVRMGGVDIGRVLKVGYASESSFGAISYFLRDREILIDSPRFAQPLVKRLGHVRRMLLTHQDDVADHEKFHQRFGCERVLHHDDVKAHTAMMELQPSGSEAIELESDLLMIPTPGHTRGHTVFLYRGKYLFTGDHLAWSPTRGHLYAFRSACWYSWPVQITSMERSKLRTRPRLRPSQS